MASGRFAQTRRDSRRCMEYLQNGQYHRIQSFLEGSTREYRRSFFGTKVLRGCLHEAIKCRNLWLLQFLVTYCEAPIEALNDQGLTPLYNAVSDCWVEGAMTLLNHGASIHNADQSLSNASCMYPPLVHAVVAAGSQPLLREVIMRGANINVLNLGGQNCLESLYYFPTHLISYIQEEMKKANPLQNENIPRTRQVALECSVYSCKDSALVAGLMANQHSQDPRKTMLLRGAWHVTKGHYASAFDCWEKHFQSLGSGDDESLAFDSAWPGILHVNDRRLLEEGSLSQDNELNYNTFALLVMATYAPAGKKLLGPMEGILFRLEDHGKLITTLQIMKHLTAVRVLNKCELTFLVDRWLTIFSNSREQSEIPFSLLLDSVMIASRCLSALTMDGSFSTNRGLTTRHDFSSDYNCCSLCKTASRLFRIVLKTMSIFHLRVSSSQEQLQHLSSHIKDFVCTFPWICGENIFHYIRHLLLSGLVTASSIQTLVALSAEARGTNRHENMPPHLSSDKDGDTPLHVYARLLIPRVLVEEGVLQCFLDHGAHLCIRNNQGKSVRDILVRRGLLPEAELLPSLQCLAAVSFMNDANLRRNVDNCRPQKIRRILLDH